MSIVSVKDIRKSYNKGRTRALKGVSFDVNQGEIFGLIGPDGAGKTSLFRILTTLILPDSGSASIDGMDIVKDFRHIRKKIGYMPGRFSLYQDMTVEENLNFFATVFNTTIAENYHLVEDIYRQIEPFKKRRAGKLSGGMKQKLALSCALIHAPKVLFLDEPTTGVDPVSRKEFWEMLQRLKENYKLSIIVSTPYMDEAMQCDRIALIKDGKFLTIDMPDAIIARYDQRLWAVRADDMHRLLTELRAWKHCLTAFSFGEMYHVTVDNEASQADLITYLADLGHENIKMGMIKASIEDSFMTLSNRNLENEQR